MPLTMSGEGRGIVWFFSRMPGSQQFLGMSLRMPRSVLDEAISMPARRLPPFDFAQGKPLRFALGRQPPKHALSIANDNGGSQRQFLS